MDVVRCRTVAVKSGFCEEEEEDDDECASCAAECDSFVGHDEVSWLLLRANSRIHVDKSYIQRTVRADTRTEQSTHTDSPKRHTAASARVFTLFGTIVGVQENFDVREAIPSNSYLASSNRFDVPK